MSDIPSYTMTHDAELIDETIDQADTNTAAIATITDSLSKVVPPTASESNPLATNDFVNSSIEQMAANRVTSDAGGNPFPTRNSLLTSSVFFHNGVPYTPSTHDYALVSADEGAPAPFTNGQTRHEYSGSQWDFAYGINNQPFTSAQNAALNSGITSTGVANLNLNTSARHTHVNKSVLDTITSVPAPVGFSGNDNGEMHITRRNVIQQADRDGLLVIRNGGSQLSLTYVSDDAAEPGSADVDTGSYKIQVLCAFDNFSSPGNIPFVVSNAILGSGNKAFSFPIRKGQKFFCYCTGQTADYESYGWRIVR